MREIDLCCFFFLSLGQYDMNSSKNDCDLFLFVFVFACEKVFLQYIFKLAQNKTVIHNNESKKQR